MTDMWHLAPIGQDPNYYEVRPGPGPCNYHLRHILQQIAHFVNSPGPNATAKDYFAAMANVPVCDVVPIRGNAPYKAIMRGEEYEDFHHDD